MLRVIPIEKRYQEEEREETKNFEPENEKEYDREGKVNSYKISANKNEDKDTNYNDDNSH